MKKDIHPKYYPNAKVICACGNTWETGSTKPEIRTDLCSACHPFFTGEMRIVDTAGQVERFVKRLEKRSEMFEEAPPASVSTKKGKRPSKKIVYELVDEEEEREAEARREAEEAQASREAQETEAAEETEEASAEETGA